MSANEPRSPDASPAPDPGESLIDRIMTRLGLKAPASIRDDLEDALEESAAAGEFSPHERAMLKNVLGLRQMRVDDVMVPRADIVAVDTDITLGELLREFRAAAHSRLPVYAETLDDPRGMVHIRDFVDHLALSAETGGERGDGLDLGRIDLATPLSRADILRPVLFVPPSMPALDLLLKMQSTRTHMALVIDEFGGTDGLVSIEDLVETVVGDIEDEHDFDDGPAIATGADGRIIADGRASLEDVSAVLGLDLAEGDLAEDVDTLGGLIAALAGRVPTRGETISGPAGFEFEILDADSRRIKRLRILQRRSGGAMTSEARESDTPAPIHDAQPRETAQPHADGFGEARESSAARS